MTAVEETIRQRRSVRRFEDREVPRELLLRVLEAARWAPSAMNRQPWHFVVVTAPERRAALVQATEVAGIPLQRHVARAPVLIALCGDERKSGWYVHDCCLASENLILAATALGLGTCWIGAFDEGKAASALGLPEGVRVVGLLTLGFPKGQVSDASPRDKLEDMVHWEEFSAERANTRGRASLWSLVRGGLRMLR